MKIVKLDHLDKIVFDSTDAKGVAKQVPVGVADGTPNMSMRVISVEPDGYTPFHSHPWEHLNYILNGEGVMVDEAGEKRPIKAGDFAFVAPDEKHQFKNSGDIPLQFICLVPKEHE